MYLHIPIYIFRVYFLVSWHENNRLLLSLHVVLVCYSHQELINYFIIFYSEFDVPSLNFPGQVHQWRLSQLLQKGYLRAHTSLLNDLALAARFIIVTAKTRIFGHFFSVTQAARAFLKGFWRLLDMFIGVPSLLAHNIDYKIKEERCRYLVAELVCRVCYKFGNYA